MAATTGDALNHAIDKASDGIAQLAHALSTAAPQAWGLLVRATFAEGLVNVVTGGFAIITGVILAVTCAKVGSTSWEDPKPRCFLAIFLGLASAILLVSGIVNFCAGDNWFRIISPDGYLAKQFLSKAL